MGKKTQVILDCETVSIKNNIICDIAWIVISKNRIIKQVNYIVSELLPEMPKGDFSGDKLIPTLAEVANGRAEFKPWLEIAKELAADLQAAEYAYAYNMAFDRGKISETSKKLGYPQIAEWFDRPKIFGKWVDLWLLASHTIMYRKSYIDFCAENGLLTPKGFCSTTAETCLRYMGRGLTYTEKHTALEDVLDEYEIYLEIKRILGKELGKSELGTVKNDFKGKPFYNVKRLQDAMTS